jgi:hypothetical protein
VLIGVCHGVVFLTKREWSFEFVSCSNGLQKQA